MISDTLSDAARSIRRYLRDPAFAGCYEGMEPRILALVRQMDALRRELDTPPTRDERREDGQ